MVLLMHTTKELMTPLLLRKSTRLARCDITAPGREFCDIEVGAERLLRHLNVLKVARLDNQTSRTVQALKLIKVQRVLIVQVFRSGRAIRTRTSKWSRLNNLLLSMIFIW